MNIKDYRNRLSVALMMDDDEDFAHMVDCIFVCYLHERIDESKATWEQEIEKPSTSLKESLSAEPDWDSPDPFAPEAPGAQLLRAMRDRS